MSHLLLASIPDDLFTVGVPLAEKVLRTIAVYVGILVLLRLAGKRDLAQLNTFDLVVLLLLSNVVQNAVIGPDNSLLGGIIGAVDAARRELDRGARRPGERRAPSRSSRAPPRRWSRMDRWTTQRWSSSGCGRPTSSWPCVGRAPWRSTTSPEPASSQAGRSSLTLRDDANPATKADVERLEAKLDRLLAG